VRDDLKGGDSLIWFCCLRSDYSETIEYRLKQSIPLKIVTHLTSGRLQQKSALRFLIDKKLLLRGRNIRKTILYVNEKLSD
jgi:hypothetical protein